MEGQRADGHGEARARWGTIDVARSMRVERVERGRVEDGARERRRSSR